MTADIISLGTRLRQRREELGLTQAQAARELDVARTAYRLWEMEAARPAPDRWRAIARWLGISMTAMLLAGELLSEQEAIDADQAAVGAGFTSAAWEARSARSDADYFSQERAMIADQARTGTISPRQAAGLQTMLARLQDATVSEDDIGWHAGRFRKRFPSNELAPGLSRAALTATAVGIPAEPFHDALLLTSELVTNSIRHSGSDSIQLDVLVDAHRLRIEVGDQNTQSLRPRTPAVHGGWGLTLVGELATRWGVERHDDGKTIWVELDLR
jgi:transcriptional regulator with XRE-family HTH domain/anti-sigma regulatory factor (Ser/Thr protein kinase)